MNIGLQCHRAPMRGAGAKRLVCLMLAGLLVPTSAVQADITINPGPANPVYPATMPDPWIVPGTLTPNGELTIDDGSQVSVGTLDMGGAKGEGLFVNTGGQLDAEQIDFLGGVGSNTQITFNQGMLAVTNDATFAVGAAGPADPGNSALTFEFTNSDLAAGNFNIRATGGANTLIADAAQSTLDIDNDFRIETPGDDNSLSFSSDSLSGTVGGDFVVRGGSSTSSVGAVMTDNDLNVGGDFIIDAVPPGQNGHDSTVVTTGLTLDAGGDVVFRQLAGNDDADQSHTMLGSQITAGRDIVWDYTEPGRTYTSANTVFGAARSVLDAGRDIIVSLPGTNGGLLTTDVAQVGHTWEAQRRIMLEAGPTNGADTAAARSTFSSSFSDITLIAPTVVIDMPLTAYDGVAVQGDLELGHSAGGVLPVIAPEYTATGSGLTFPSFTATGTANINGRGLEVSQANSSSDPALYESGLIIDADGGATGAFDTVSSPDFGDNTALAVTYDSDGVRATRAYLGDANVNTGVGLHDYIITANNQGETGTWADGNFGNGLGNVAGDDLAQVVNNFGMGTAETPGPFNDLIELTVNLDDGSLTLQGDATLRGFSITSESGALNPSAGPFTNLFDTQLAWESEAIVLGDNGDGVELLDMAQLNSEFFTNLPQDVIFGYGLTNANEFYAGQVSYIRGDDPRDPGDPNVIPTPGAAAAGLLLLAGLSLRRRRARA